jgi:thiamine transporter ThiT
MLTALAAIILLLGGLQLLGLLTITYTLLMIPLAIAAVFIAWAAIAGLVLGLYDLAKEWLQRKKKD